MNVGTNTYAMTWNAALATQGGLLPIVKAWNSFTPEVLDGFQMAQAGQLARLSSDLGSGNLRLKSAVSEMALNNLAHVCLRLDQNANGEKRIGQRYTWDATQSDLREIHETRMKIFERWFEFYAERDFSEVAVPSSIQESLVLYWSVLLEKPKALELATEADGPHLLAHEGRVLAGFRMALASLVTMLPHYGAADSALAIAKEMILLSDQELAPKDRLSHVEQIVRKLQDTGDPLARAVGDLRSPGGMWSLEGNKDDVKSRSPFRSLPQFDANVRLSSKMDKQHSEQMETLERIYQHQR